MLVLHDIASGKTAQFLYRHSDDSLKAYSGARDTPDSFGGRILDTPELEASFPVNFALSEKETPPIKLDTKASGRHFGISQVVFASPAIIALVEYEPGG